jgi:hypothetical protein
MTLHPSFRPEVQRRRQQEFDQAGTRAEVDQLIQRWQREDLEGERVEAVQTAQIRALQERVRHLEEMLLDHDRVGLSDAVVDIVAMALARKLDEVESRMLKFLGVHQIGRTYPANAVVVKSGSLWISPKLPGCE